MATGGLPISEETLLVAVLAAGLAAVHLIADRAPASDLVSRNQLRSAASGASIAYVFAYLLPDLDDRAAVLEEVDWLAASLGAHHVFYAVFAGLVLFYGLERLAQVTRTRGEIADEPVFWAHLGTFVVYNAVVGYVLSEGRALADGLAFAAAMALHLFGIDEGLRHHHEEAYHRAGRWVLAGAVLAGGALGLAVDVGDVALTLTLALLAGGIVFNAIKEELPEDREGSFWAFAAGAGGYALVLALVL